MNNALEMIWQEHKSIKLPLSVIIAMTRLFQGYFRRSLTESGLIMASLTNNIKDRCSSLLGHGAQSHSIHPFPRSVLNSCELLFTTFLQKWNAHHVPPNQRKSLVQKTNLYSLLLFVLLHKMSFYTWIKAAFVIYDGRRWVGVIHHRVFPIEREL